MFGYISKKDKKIAKLEKKVKYKDELIEDLDKQNSELRRENVEVYAESKEVCYENCRLKGTIENIKELISKYEETKGNIFSLIRDIKNELVKTGIKN